MVNKSPEACLSLKHRPQFMTCTKRLRGIRLAPGLTRGYRSHSGWRANRSFKRSFGWIGASSAATKAS